MHFDWYLYLYIVHFYFANSIYLHIFFNFRYFECLYKNNFVVWKYHITHDTTMHWFPHIINSLFTMFHFDFQLPCIFFCVVCGVVSRCVTAEKRLGGNFSILISSFSLLISHVYIHDLCMLPIFYICCIHSISIHSTHIWSKWGGGNGALCASCILFIL